MINTFAISKFLAGENTPDNYIGTYCSQGRGLVSIVRGKMNTNKVQISTNTCFDVVYATNNTASTNFTITVFQTPAVSITLSGSGTQIGNAPLEYIAGASGNITLTATGADYYSWSIESGSSNVVTGSVATLTEGFYTLNTISYANEPVYGCCNSIEIIVRPKWWRLEDGETNSVINQPVFIYPNPAEGWFYIEGNNSGNAEEADLIICNLQGQIIYRQRIILATGKWLYKYKLANQGIYFVRLNSAHHSYKGSVISINE